MALSRRLFIARLELNLEDASSFVWRAAGISLKKSFEAPSTFLWRDGLRFGFFFPISSLPGFCQAKKICSSCK
jgi:hypothetical protein